MQQLVLLEKLYRDLLLPLGLQGPILNENTRQRIEDPFERFDLKNSWILYKP